MDKRRLNEIEKHVSNSGEVFHGVIRASRPALAGHSDPVHLAHQTLGEKLKGNTASALYDTKG